MGSMGSAAMENTRDSRGGDAWSDTARHDGARRSARRPAPHQRPRGRGRPGRGAAGSGDRLAHALGWFSIGLGVAEVTAPSGLARLIGIEDREKSRDLLRALGVRELTAGVGILGRPRPAGWMWARVAGDVMDLALLGRALSAGSTRPDRTRLATAAVIGVTALDVLCGEQISRRAGRTNGDAGTGRTSDGAHHHGVQVTRSITVNRPAEEVYAFWRDVANLPRFMRHLQSVRTLDARRSHWVAHAPAGMTVEWDAEIVEDRPGELIAWRSLPGADVDNTGSVSFRRAPGDRGTEVTVELAYSPPGGLVSSKLAKLFHEEPGQQVFDDLRAFKQVLETGEVVRSDATVRRGPHAARPDGSTR